jgi:hypothetical protein
MNPSFEQTLVDVWWQALIENVKFVELGKAGYPVRRTPKRGLRQVDFVFDGNEIRGLEQNPDTKSRWAQMARSGKKVMRFLSEGRYMANVVDGKVTPPGSATRRSKNRWRRLFWLRQIRHGKAESLANNRLSRVLIVTTR